MILLRTLVFILCFHSLVGQTIYDYEREVNAENEVKSLGIDFVNSSDKLTLSGTLLYPTDGYEKIVLIVPGSGKDTRHSHFFLTENFLKNNIAVYRFDERGIGKSEGKYDYTATTLMEDVIAAYHKLITLPELKNKKLGVLGHSLGGIASIGASGKGCEFAFLIQMATPVEKDGAFIKYQALRNTDGFYSAENKSATEVIAYIDTMSQLILQYDDYKTIKRKGKKKMKALGFKKSLHMIINPLQVDLVKQNHEATYQNCPVPMLYIVGSEDRIVSPINEPNTLKQLNNSNVDIQIIDYTNHWLSDQIAPTKMDASLYQMNPLAIDAIVSWTLNL